MLKYAIQTFRAPGEKFHELGRVVLEYASAAASEGFFCRKGNSVYQDAQVRTIMVTGPLGFHSALQDARSCPHSKTSKLLARCMSTTGAEERLSTYDVIGTEDDTYCMHTQWKSLCLVSNSILGISSVQCNQCRGCIARYRLHLDPSTADLLWRWEQQYDHICNCWLLSGEYEEFAAAALQNPRSDLNELGLRVAGLLRLELNVEVQYFLHSGDEHHVACQRCGSILRDASAPQWNAVCDNCGIVTERSVPRGRDEKSEERVL